MKRKFSEYVMRFRRKSVSEKITYTLFFVFFLTMAIALVFPLASTFLNSFRTLDDYYDPYRNPFALPVEWQTKSWAGIFTEFQYAGNSYLRMLWNSLWVLVLRVVVNVMSSTLLAYAVARFRFPGRGFLYGVAIFAQTIPIIGSGASGYKLLSALNMVNNPALLWLAWAVGFDFAFIVLYGTFKGVSQSYSEAAKIDGANNLTVLFKIIFPQAFPSVMALAITQAISVWNDYSTIMIYLRKFPTLAYGLYVFPQAATYVENSSALYSAAICLSIIPVLLLYALNQKTILTNMTAGGLKG